jgi:hypothetical protein
MTVKQPANPASRRRSLYDRIHDRFAALGGVDLDLPPREAVHEPSQFLKTGPHESDAAGSQSPGFPCR